jgi:riboflavin synthase
LTHTVFVFTGIVQGVGSVLFLDDGRLMVALPDDFPAVTEGESIAVNGVCLTLVRTKQGGGLRYAMATEDLLAEGLPSKSPTFVIAEFNVSEETLLRTNLGHLDASDGNARSVNLERAATLATLFGGHIVQGHVDCTALVASITAHEHSTVYRFKVPAEHDRYLIDKGSVTIDGVSLTVVEPSQGVFDTSIIPHTLQHTNLRERKIGDLVNIEFDVLAKHVDKLLQHLSQ